MSTIGLAVRRLEAVSPENPAPEADGWAEEPGSCNEGAADSDHEEAAP